MNREVRSAESKSVDPMKMKTIQARTGSQNFTNPRTKNETTMPVLVLISRRRNCRASLQDAVVRWRLAETPYKR